MNSDRFLGQTRRFLAQQYVAKLILSAVVLSGGLTACGGGDESDPVPIAFVTVDRGSRSELSYSEEGFLSRVARSDSEWQAIWLSNYSGNRPPPAPAVDFNQYMVIGVILGLRSNGCYGIEVREVLLSAEQVEVVYAELTPNGSGCQAVVVSPYEFISIPTTTLTVRFRKS